MDNRKKEREDEEIDFFTVALLLASQANAALITWTTNSITGSTNDVNNTGTTVKAVNTTATGYASANPSVAVNGVTFTATGAILRNDWGGDSWAPAADTEYDALLSHIDYNASGTTMFTVDTFTGLTEGRDYLLQVWHTDSDQVRAMTLDSFDSDGSMDVVLDGTTYAVGTFTADATESQSLAMAASANGLRLAAYQLRLQPPKGTVMSIR